MDPKTERWDVFTMTHDAEMFDENGQPIDDPDYSEWSVGYDITWGSSSEFSAAVAGVVAENMTYGTACYMRDLHNEKVTA